MRRFLIDSADLAGPELVISGEIFHHMIKVLRLKKGASVIVADGRGQERTGIIEEISKDNTTLILTDSPASPQNASIPAITIFQGLPKGDKMETIVQKCTELGVATLVPFAAERSIRKIRGEREDELVERWQRIAREAARQSGRVSKPDVRFAGSLSAALCDAHHTVKLMLWEEERTVRLKQLLSELPKPEQIAVIIGPEGGISHSEAAVAEKAGFQQVTLGERIVRTETAPIIILSILQFLWGDIG